MRILRWSVVLLGVVCLGTTSARGDQESASALRARVAAGIRSRLIETARAERDASHRAPLEERRKVVSARADEWRKANASLFARVHALVGDEATLGWHGQADALERTLTSGRRAGDFVLKSVGAANSTPMVDAVLDQLKGAPLLARLRLRPDKGDSGSSEYAALKQAVAEGADYTLLHPSEPTWPHCAQFVQLRRTQSEHRVAALRADQPSSSLISPSAVALRTDRAATLEQRSNTAKKQRAAISVGLDLLVETEQRLRREAGARAFRLDEARANAPEGSEPPTFSTLDEIRDFLGQEELRLVYATARRADLLRSWTSTELELLATEYEEALAAASRWRHALERTRRERQIDSLKFDRDRLLLDRAGLAESEDASAPTMPYRAALDHMVAMNEQLERAVTVRRVIEAAIQPSTGADATSSSPSNLMGSQIDEATTSDEFEALGAPSAERLTAAYVETALPHIGSFTVDQLEAHDAAAEARLGALQGAIREGEVLGDVSTQFGRALSGAQGSLTQTLSAARKGKALHDWQWKIRQARAAHVDEVRGAFDDTLAGARSSLENVNEQHDALRTLRKRLNEVGATNLRRRRALSQKNLTETLGDVEATTERGVTWLTGSGKDSARGFVERKWMWLLACLGVLLSSYFFVRHGRRILDRVLDRLAAATPALPLRGMTVQEEVALAKQQREDDDAALREVEEKTLKDASANAVQADDRSTPVEEVASDESSDEEEDA